MRSEPIAGGFGHLPSREVVGQIRLDGQQVGRYIQGLLDALVPRL